MNGADYAGKTAVTHYLYSISNLIGGNGYEQILLYLGQDSCSGKNTD